MAYIRYKIFGKKEYAYEVTAKYNSEKKRCIQKQKYLGVVLDKENQIFKKPRKEELSKLKSNNQEPKKERAILDYGDTKALEIITRKGELWNTIKNTMGSLFESVMCLIYYRIIVGSAMCYSNNWYEGNVINQIYPNANLKSQRISELLYELSDENLQRFFLEKYLKHASTSGSIAIDSTGLPNQINFPLCDWGHHNNTIEKETRLIFSVDTKTKLPLYFRAVAGNINDVSTLETTITEMKKQGIKTEITILDAGYCSESNIKALYNSAISFLTRLPSNRKIYSNLILQYSSSLEEKENIVLYHKRAVFIKTVKIDLYGKKGFAYVICDPVKRGNEIQKAMLKIEDNENNFNTSNCGKFIFISKKQCS